MGEIGVEENVRKKLIPFLALGSRLFPESEGGGGWERVYFEGDLGIDAWRMKELGTGVSMELMRRSEVFIGNG